MAGGDDPIKRREQARELVAEADRQLALAGQYYLSDIVQTVHKLHDAALSLTKAVKLLLDP